MQTWAALAIWLRFLLYLRTVDQFSWMVRMITECIYDMLPFFTIFMISVLAFSDAFLSIDQGLQLLNLIPERDVPVHASYYEKYFQGYIVAIQKSYLTSLGEFDDSLEHYDEWDWLVFFICTIFNIVLLLNLLIAIISETFANIKESKDETSYKEKVN